MNVDQARLLINSHFEQLIVRTHSIVFQQNGHALLDENKEKIVKKIEEIQQSNISNLEHLNLNDLETSKMEDLISIDCLLVEEFHATSLWVVPCFFNEMSRAFFK